MGAASPDLGAPADFGTPMAPPKPAMPPASDDGGEADGDTITLTREECDTVRQALQILTDALGPGYDDQDQGGGPDLGTEDTDSGAGMAPMMGGRGGYGS